MKARLARAPGRPPLEELRPRERDDHDRRRAAPLHQVIDEVEQADVGVVRLLEDHDDRQLRRQVLEERPPRGEELVRVDGRALAQPEQREECGLDPARLFLVRDVLADDCCHALPRRRLVVGLDEARAAADHLAERPERDALAVGRAAAGVPPDLLDQPVEVLLELPRQARLADPRRPHDAHEARLPLACAGVEQVLEQAQLLVPPDERRLERLAAVAAADAPPRPERPARPAPAPACPSGSGRRPARRRWPPTRPAASPRPRARFPGPPRTGGGSRCSRGRRRPCPGSARRS